LETIRYAYFYFYFAATTIGWVAGFPTGDDPL